jgi:hypothetical protein
MDLADTIRCHGNLNRGCLSVVPKGAKTELHYNVSVTLTDAEFRCSTAGHRRILSRGSREVVARCHGTVSAVHPVDRDIYANDSRYIPVSYNPIRHPDRPYFYTLDGQPIGKVARAYIITCNSIDTKARTRAYIDAPH